MRMLKNNICVCVSIPQPPVAASTSSSPLPKLWRGQRLKTRLCRSANAQSYISHPVNSYTHKPRCPCALTQTWLAPFFFLSANCVRSAFVFLTAVLKFIPREYTMEPFDPLGFLVFIPREYTIEPFDPLGFLVIFLAVCAVCRAFRSVNEKRAHERIV